MFSRSASGFGAKRLAGVLARVAALAGGAALFGCQQGPGVAECGPWCGGTLCHAGTAEQAKDFSALDRFGRLAGRWSGQNEHGTMVVEYQTLADGSVVEERLFPGTSHEMRTMYFTHYGRLHATHYCAAKNQPTMVGSWDAGAVAWHFTHVRTTNANERDVGVMGDMSYFFVDDNTLRVQWRQVKDGKIVGAAFGGVFKRSA